MENQVIKEGTRFEKDSRIFEVTGRHGAKFAVKVMDFNMEVEHTAVMSKQELLDCKVFTGKLPATKLMKISPLEKSILSAINKASHDAPVGSSTIEVDGMNKLQLAGHISILERKGLIVLERITSKKKDVSVSPLGEAFV